METLFASNNYKNVLPFPLKHQVHLIGALNRAMEKDMVATSYILEGERGSGRYCLASQFAKALLCSYRNSIPACGECVQCKKIEKGIHPDVIKIEHDERYIKISEVRYLAGEVYKKPNEADRKVVIIKDAERMTEEAVNSMLKVFEEPPYNVVIILTVVNSSLLPATIVSRSIHLFMSGIPTQSVVEHVVEMYGIDRDKAEVLVGATGGDTGLIDEIVKDDGLYSSITKGEFFNYVIGILDPTKIVIERERAKKLIIMLLNYIRYRSDDFEDDTYAKLLYLLGSTNELLIANINVKVSLFRLMIELKEMMASTKGGIGV
ncbi:MAG: hypothetical protein DRH51_04340 [Candidatus Coatesbacteria bacterium]|nr:MAG: hypothetical protein DRH51_04340 [Candidatus Coatesbacteria bacterium]